MKQEVKQTGVVHLHQKINVDRFNTCIQLLNSKHCDQNDIKKIDNSASSKFDLLFDYFNNLRQAKVHAKMLTSFFPIRHYFLVV